MIRFGVSPAFVVSRFGPGFSIGDFATALSEIHALGFTAFQPEVFTAGTLDDWAGGGAARLARQAEGLGLQASQFVAHFLLENFATAERLTGHADLEAVRRALGCAQAFAGCGVFTVPLAPFRADGDRAIAPADSTALRHRLAAKVHAYRELTEAAGMRLALEVLPFSLLGNTEGFLRLAAELGAPELGINLDTGHAWATRENLALLPGKLAGRILGVHLKDNDSDHNQPLAPGRGTIPWAALLASLLASGYRGSLDLEIGCAADEVAHHYPAGRAHLQTCLPAAPPPS